MSNLIVKQVGSDLVIDSKLIAEELGIQHKSFKELIRTYISDFETFGTVTLVAAEGKPLPQGGFSNGETYYYLNEDQSYLALTYSKNSEKVRQAKVNLVKAFKLARESKLPSTYLDSLKLLIAAEEEKQLLLEQNKELNQFKNEVSEWDKFIELLDITKNEVTENDYPDGITVYEYLIANNNSDNNEYVDPINWATIARRAGNYHRLLEGQHPPKRGNRNYFVGKKVAYIIATIRLVQSGI